MVTWQNVWVVHSDGTSAAGGQGSIRKVFRCSDQRLGALKEQHAINSQMRERRFRAKQEVEALRALAGQGAPELLDHNTEQWEDDQVPLYFVAEWIDGRTLADRVNGNALPLDVALQVSRRLTEIVGRCHGYGIHHRDLKPDNTMLRASDDDVILIDFGMAWKRPPEDEEPEYKTHHAQELGNRFLRMPENAPGHHRHDERSDITLVVGLLFYMITGVAPRQLHDSKGLMPHESPINIIPEAVLRDARWESLRRIFNNGFQQSPEHRIQSSSELLKRIDSLRPVTQPEIEEALRQEIERFADERKSSQAQEKNRFRDALTKASNRFNDVLKSGSHNAELTLWIGGPTAVDDGTKMEATYAICERGTQNPRVECAHVVEVQATEYIGSVKLENDKPLVYYRHSVGDVDAFIDAAGKRATVTLTSMLQMLRRKLSSNRY